MRGGFYAGKICKKIYLPIYMMMFLENEKMVDMIYKLDLAGLTFNN